MFFVLRPLAAIALALTLGACVAPSTQYQDVSGAQTATAILRPLVNWNPVAGQPSRPGSAAYGQVDINNGRVYSQQTYSAWTASGKPLPRSVIRQQERNRRWQQQQYYDSLRYRPRYCYDSYYHRQYRC